MKQFQEFIPLIAFFAAYKFYDFYVATGVLIVATVIQVGLNFIKTRKVEKMPLILLVMVSVFGGFTLFFQDTAFLKWKVSVVNWLFGAGLLITYLINKQPIIKTLLGKEITMPEKIWVHLNHAWAVFFFAAGFLNIYIAYNYSEEFWVNFKVFGLLGITFVFTIISAIYMSKYMEETPNETSEEQNQ